MDALSKVVPTDLSTLTESAKELIPKGVEGESGMPDPTKMLNAATDPKAMFAAVTGSASGTPATSTPSVTTVVFSEEELKKIKEIIQVVMKEKVPPQLFADNISKYIGKLFMDTENQREVKRSMMNAIFTDLNLLTADNKIKYKFIIHLATRPEIETLLNSIPFNDTYFTVIQEKLLQPNKVIAIQKGGMNLEGSLGSLDSLGSLTNLAKDVKIPESSLTNLAKDVKIPESSLTNLAENVKIPEGSLDSLTKLTEETPNMVKDFTDNNPDKVNELTSTPITASSTSQKKDDTEEDKKTKTLFYTKMCRLLDADVPDAEVMKLFIDYIADFFTKETPEREQIFKKMALQIQVFIDQLFESPEFLDPAFSRYLFSLLLDDNNVKEIIENPLKTNPDQKNNATLIKIAFNNEYNKILGFPQRTLGGHKKRKTKKRKTIKKQKTKRTKKQYLFFNGIAP
jgi:hypothetical protein